MDPSLGISFSPFILSDIRLLAQTRTFIFWTSCLGNAQLQAPNNVWCSVFPWEAPLSIFGLIAQGPSSMLKAAKGK